jgi:hypothetical protein
MDTRDEELFERLQLGQVVWDRPKVEVVGSREEERLVLSPLVVLVVASLADTITHQLDVKPPLLAPRTSLHLLCSKRLVKLSLDSNVFWRQRGLLVVARKPWARLVEIARRGLGAVSSRGISSRGSANRVACESRATTSPTTRPYGLRKAGASSQTTARLRRRPPD